MKKIEFELEDSIYNGIVKEAGEDNIVEFCKTAVIGKLSLRRALTGLWLKGIRDENSSVHKAKAGKK